MASRLSDVPATFYFVKAGNDCTWRAEWPAEVLGARCATVLEPDVDRAFMAPNNDTPLPWTLRATDDEGSVAVIDSKDAWSDYTQSSPRLALLETEFPEHEGTAVFTRPCVARAVLAKAMRQEGIRTVAETDDNYFANPNLNLFSREQGANEDVHEMHSKAMASMGVNVFSTPWLRDRYMREYRRRFGKQGLPEMHVCGNHVPSWAWPDMPEYDGPLRVGFMGSPSHVWDIHLGYAALHAAKALGATTTMIGYNPADPDPDIPDTVDVDGETFHTRSEKSRAVSAKWGEVIDTHIRWIDPGEYHRAPLPLDIGIAPVLYNDFTCGKSDAKALEYAISGAACVLQNHPIYNRAGWVHEENCLLAGSQEEMGLAVVRLIRDPKLRLELLANAREYVMAERNEHVMKTEWLSAINA